MDSVAPSDCFAYSFPCINIDLSYVLSLPGMPLIRMSARALKTSAYIVCYWMKAVALKTHKEDRITAAKAALQQR